MPLLIIQSQNGLSEVSKSFHIPELNFLSFDAGTGRDNLSEV
jgi:hypothetical protein